MNKPDAWELNERFNLPLDIKIRMTQDRIRNYINTAWKN